MPKGDAFKWSQEDLEIVKNNYGKIQTHKIRDLLSKPRSNRGITVQARKMGVKRNLSLARRQYFCDFTYFDIPNIENSYWAGYIAADGNVKYGKQLELGCAISDREIIDNFNICTKNESPVHIKKAQKKKIIKKICNMQAQTRLHISSKEWIIALEKNWNIVSNKSLILQPPNITELNHKLAYIIGYLDGDGSASLRKLKRKTGTKLDLKVGFVAGDPTILEWIRNTLKECLPHLIWKDKVNQEDTHKFTITWSSKKAIEIHKYLKEAVDIPFKLRRKWDINYTDLEFKPLKRKNKHESKHSKST
jgi:predicted metal-dependent hydrolase